MNYNFLLKLFFILISILIVAKAVFEIIEFYNKLQVLIAAHLKILEDLLPQSMNITQKDFEFKVKSIYGI